MGRPDGIARKGVHCSRGVVAQRLWTLLIAAVAIAALVLAACGGGGTDEEPQPHRPVDCKARPELCK